MLFLLTLAIYLLSAPPILAQIPLHYQLIESYRPSSDTYIPPVLVVPTPAQYPTLSPPPTNYGQTITIAVLGDSMIDTLGPGLPQLNTALGQYFPGRAFKILNYGVGSRDIEYGIYRLTHEYDYRDQHFPSLLSQNPDIVVVESFAYNNFSNTQAGIDHYLTALKALITDIRSALPNTQIVIAATIAPNSIIFGNGVSDLHLTALEKIEKSSTIKLYLQNAIDFATSENIPLADAYHLSLFDGEGLKSFINAGDDLHPSLAGGQFFCDIVADTIYRSHLVK